MHSKYFFSAGEVSGDVYGAELIQSLRHMSQDNAVNLHFYGLGGPNMQAAGMVLLDDVRAYSAVGLSENMAALPYFSQLLKRLRSWLRQVRPEVMVLIDFQGLNMQLAALGKDLGIPVYYLMAPQDWIWGFKSGVDRIRHSVSAIFSVFPQESQFYRAANVPVLEIGHPLLDMLPQISKAEARQKLGVNPSDKIVCWMPGSRKHELDRLLPVLKNVQKKFSSQWVHVYPQAMDFKSSSASDLWSDVTLVSQEQRHLALLASDLVIGASGNMVLESALLGTPVIALYQVSVLTYAAAKLLVRSPWITLPNILLQQSLVPEFIQRLKPEDIYLRALEELKIESKWKQVQKELLQLLGSGNAMNRAAEFLLALHYESRKG